MSLRGEKSPLRQTHNESLEEIITSNIWEFFLALLYLYILNVFLHPLRKMNPLWKKTKQNKQNSLVAVLKDNYSHKKRNIRLFPIEKHM